MVVTVVVMLTSSGDGDIGDGDDQGNDGYGDGTCDGSDE